MSLGAGFFVLERHLKETRGIQLLWPYIQDGLFVSNSLNCSGIALEFCPKFADTIDVFSYYAR
jgi:hypothetical protein